jgi:hypothetical protein
MKRVSATMAVLLLSSGLALAQGGGGGGAAAGGTGVGGTAGGFDRIRHDEPNQSQCSPCSPDQWDRRPGSRYKPQQFAGSEQPK